MYIPSNKILKKYADVLIKYALWGGKGIRKNDVVYLSVPESSKPMLIPLQKAILEEGANVIIDFVPEGIDRNFLERANENQLEWTPKTYLLERIKTCDHFVRMISTNDKFELKGVDSKKIMSRSKALKYYMDARTAKENEGKLTWTLGLFGTEAMAKEAGVTFEEYWQQIINACFLDLDDPISKWKEVLKEIESIKKVLNKLNIKDVHVEGDDVDLKIEIGKNRQWVGGSGRNIPSFEIFTSPDWRGTNGWAKFSQPLYRYGNLITGIELEFKDGIIVKSKATKNQKLLKDMIKVENADKIGEFSLTDKRFSRITKFMAETLYDENIGGKYGNFHIALGLSYKDCFIGDTKPKNKGEWKRLGFNDSAIHTDIISTSDRIVTATLGNGDKKVIYKGGEFNL